MSLLSYQSILGSNSYVNRCRWVENPGGRVAKVFAKIPWGSRLSGRSPYFGFYCIFINKSFEICLGSPMLASPSLPRLHLWLASSFLSLVHFSREFSTSRFSREVPFLTRNENETRSRSWLS